MKRIVICCDGTWKRVDATCPTNVVKIAQAIEPRGHDGIAQFIFHLDGVGTGQGTGAIARGIDRAMGGIFGHGLLASIETAYRVLIFNYAPGDAIFLFGFSRGAFMARSLAGLIRCCGIPAREHAAVIPAALALYRERSASGGPNAPAYREFRARFGAEAGKEMAAHGVANDTPGVRYLGVWDTVGSLGVPGDWALSLGMNRGLQFHDLRLSSWVKSARHAVAIDERRAVFPPALWDNLDALNATCGDCVRYQQRWFPGDHGSIGGGGAVSALSNDAAVWIAEGAIQAGLEFDPVKLAALAEGRDFLAPLRAQGDKARSLIDLVLNVRRDDRRGPARLDDLASSAFWRWRSDPTYRPAALSRVEDALEHSRTGS